MAITKDTPLTFGKNSGLTPAQLSLTEDGRSYLSWGADNLNNPAWRSAFRDALKSQPAEFDEAVVRKQAARVEYDDPQDDFGRGIEEYVNSARTKFEVNKREEEIFARYAQEFGMDVKRLKSLWYSWAGEDVTRKNFSSDEKFEIWQRMDNELSALIQEWSLA